MTDELEDGYVPIRIVFRKGQSELYLNPSTIASTPLPKFHVLSQQGALNPRSRRLGLSRRRC